MRRLLRVLVVVMSLTACSQAERLVTTEPSQRPQPQPEAQVTTAPAPAPATVPDTTPAAATRGPQIQLTEPPAPPTPQEVCNGIVYFWGDPGPAMLCYRVTAPTFGWSQERVEATAEFAERVMKGESNHCWNSLGGQTARYHLEPCTETTPGKYEDAGFGQITDVLRTPDSTLCGVHGICDRWQTIASPYISMWSFVHIMNEQGKRPWCYYDNGEPNLHIRNGDCDTWPLD